MTGLSRTRAKKGSTLKVGTLALGHVTAEDFDKWVDPAKMCSEG